MLLLVILICALPVAASYFTYYFVRPSSRSNYGELIEPQRSIPELRLRTLDGAPFDAATLKGKWLMLTVGGGACVKPCEDKLWHIRQVRLTTGKDRDRVERIWLVTDAAPIADTLVRNYEGTRMLRADRAELAAWLPVIDASATTGASGATALEDHIYVVDPLGNLMMRFPKDADPNKTKKDLAKLLRASAIG